LTNKENIKNAIENSVKKFGVVNILINCAGFVTGKPFVLCNDSEIEKTFQVNALSHIWASIYFLY